MNKLANPIPILRSFDEKSTKAFYLDFLGFTLEFEHRFEPGTPLYMSVQKDNCKFHISEHYGDASPGATIRIPIDDVHQYCRELNEKNYRHSRPGVQSQSWGCDEMTISDPSGNRVIFYSETSE